MRITLLVPLLALLACSCQARSVPHTAEGPGSQASYLEQQLRGLVSPGETLVVAKVSGVAPAIGVLVTHSDSAPGATCKVRIFDRSGGELIEVASTVELVDCTDVPTARMAVAQVALQVDASRIELEQTQANNSATFELRLDRSRGWLVESASYSRPEVDPNSGDIVVVRESVAYPVGTGPKVGEYSYDLVKRDLSRAIIE